MADRYVLLKFYDTQATSHIQARLSKTKWGKDHWPILLHYGEGPIIFCRL